MKKYDIVVIGTGIGGSTIATRLAKSGKNILILERGGFIPKEKDNWDPHKVMVEGKYRPKEEWLDNDGKPFKPFIHYNVGGNSKVYGAAMFRFRLSDFEKVHHYGGISPEWPVKYDVFEKYYTEAENIYSVHGLRGADPTEPPAEHPYPLPPIPYEPEIVSLAGKMEQLGLRPFPLPMGMQFPQDGSKNQPPVMLENFDGYPDPTDSKADGYSSGLRHVLDLPNVTLVTQALVTKLETDENGKRISNVIADINGEQQSFEADTVILACGAVNSAALLLKSASEKHPHGLANSSGQVGRNLMLHHNGCLVAFTKMKNRTSFQKSFGLADFYHKADNSAFPLGEIQLMGKNDPETIMSLAKDIYPEKSFDEIREMAIDFWLTAEDLPSPDNRVTLTDEGQIKVNYTRTNPEAFEKLKHKLKEVFERLGEIDPDFKDTVWNGYDLDISGMSHQNGTLRFGTDPKTSVLDVNCKAHDVDNLYVVDASFFPSCGAFNPSLTIAANALRVSEHLINTL
ncbi:GMC oxidoreductase [Mucilaginibacter ginsenosidivorans]|uniref:GMC family oxidoreductase n=1 Tax=Mucilaginibacter ginsenosidivorans TaxID=398053 RepID=A0A5B8UYP3_9SPHI|nr:GMC family oxidoreductase [Mucilaginibacter ginsenosidivorans]QEC64058.1 GMC family oxidoreductase [Mucilaginibacter ginsenosidivorans]